MDLSQKREAWSTDDQSWIASRHGLNNAKPGTLDTSLFTKATHYPDGYFRSGLPLGRVTASKKLGPYDDTATDGRQTLVGHLLSAVSAPDDNTVDPVGAVLLHGMVKESALPAPVDAAGKADVAGRLIYV